jgi:hypothetical protein
LILFHSQYFQVLIQLFRVLIFLQVVSATTKYQKMDVYDVLRPGVQSLELYKKSLLNDGSYEAKNAELFAPDRIVFLDGVMQSRRSGDAAYHGKGMQLFAFNHCQESNLNPHRFPP